MPSDPAATAPIRSFIAIDVEGPARATIDALIARFRMTGADVAWSRPDALHVTLEFLGAVAPDRLLRLGARLADVATGHRAFSVTLARVGAFPNLARPRVLWIGVDAPALPALAAAVRRACAAEGFESEERPFHPHLTIGRVRVTRGRGGRVSRELIAALAAERDAGFGVSRADSFILFQSELGAGGARHTALARFALAVA